MVGVRHGLTTALVGSTPEVESRMAHMAEDAGFDTVSVGEAAYDSFATASAVARETTRVRVLSGVATWARPPVLTATSAATADRYADGRYALGLGTMPRAWNRDWYGIDPSRPLTRMREYVAVVRRALAATDAPLHHEGEWFRVSGYRRMAPPPRTDVPIHLAATRPGMAALAGEIGDGVLFNVVHTHRWLRETLVPAVSASGRRIERGVMVRCVVDDDEERALQLARRSFAMYLGVPYFHEVAEASGHDLTEVERLLGSGDRAGALAAVPDGWLRDAALVGTAEQVRAAATRYEGLVDWLLLTPPTGLDGGALLEHTRRIVDAVGTDQEAGDDG